MRYLEVSFLSLLALQIGCSEASSQHDGAGGSGGGYATWNPTGAGTTSSGGAGGDTATGSGASSTSTTTATTSSTGTGSSTDPNEAARQTCIDKINALRATKGLSPYGRWTAAETCVDAQATSDEQTGQAHGAWSGGGDTCNGSGQNECLGGGAGNIEGCLQMMWDEKDQPGCAGCDACADAYSSSCPGCDFYGSATGDVCGHYVNMSAKYLSEAACGFSELGGWAAINFR